MTSVAKRTIPFDFSGDPVLAPQNKVNPAQLQSTLVDLYALIDTLIDAASVALRDDNTLVDALVRNRCLHAEVSTLLGITAGWQPRAAVACASTGNLALTGEQTIDGVLTSTSRILVKNQTAPAENGVYVTAAGAWARSSDTNTAAELGRSTVYVAGGMVGLGSAWVVSEEADDITLATTAITWAQFGASPTQTFYQGSGWQPKVAVACASTANLVLTGEQTIDGVLTAASRVLVKNQAVASENGIYVTGAGAWTRATDADSSGELAHAFVSVTAGTTLARSSWVVAEEVITVGTTSITWVVSNVPVPMPGSISYLFQGLQFDGTYVLIGRANKSFTITSLNRKCTGTATLALKINGTSITGLSAVAASNVRATATATALNAVVAGDIITLVISAGTVDLADLDLTIGVLE